MMFLVCRQRTMDYFDGWETCFKLMCVAALYSAMYWNSHNTANLAVSSPENLEFIYFFDCQ